MFRATCAAVSLRPIRFSFVFAAIPAVMFAVAGPRAKPQPTPIEFAPHPVETEGVRAQRLDENTFRRRWESVFSLPPAIEARYFREEVVSTVSGAAPAPQPLPSRHRPRLRSKPVKLDVCARHGMRKVWTRKGRWPSWRCRR